jgi:hypothetical protein
VSDNQRVLDLAAEIRRVDGNHSLGAAALAEALRPDHGRRAVSDNQRVLDLAAEIRRVDGNHSLGAAALAEALEPWIEAVVAEVRAEDAKHLASYRRAMLRQGRQAVARDIRADELDGFYVGNDLREHYARIAEAAPSPK